MKPLSDVEVVRKRRIRKLANDVRKKYLALKLGRSEEDETLNKLFAPVANPLKQLITQQQQQTNKYETTMKQLKDNYDTTPQQLKDISKQLKDSYERTPQQLKDISKQLKDNYGTTNRQLRNLSKRLPLQTPQKPSTPHGTYTATPKSRPIRYHPSTSKYDTPTQFLDTEEIKMESDYDDDDDEDDYVEPSMEDIQDDIAKLSDSQALQEYMEQYPEIAQPFVLKYFQSPAVQAPNYPNYDKTTSKWTLGNSVMNFDKSTGNIIVNGEIFRGSEGLYRLIFEKEPDKFSKDDLAQYKRLIEKTSLYRINHEPLQRLKGNGGYKYKNIIKPLLSSQTQGRGLSLTYNNKPIEYVYWDDVNEIVDRLRLLIASKQAGNTSHDNEILSIIEELKEAGVIY